MRLTTGEIQIASMHFGRWRCESHAKLKTTISPSLRLLRQMNCDCYLSILLALSRSGSGRLCKRGLDILAWCAVVTHFIFLPDLTRTSRQNYCKRPARTVTTPAGQSFQTLRQARKSALESGACRRPD